MMGPNGLLDTVAAMTLAVAVYASGRLLIAGRQNRHLHYDINVSHVVMGVAMAGMLAAPLHSLPDVAWEAVFAFMSVWFGVKTLRLARVRGWRGMDDDGIHRVSQYLVHVVMGLSMLYMFFSARGSSANALWLPLVFAVVLFGSAVLNLDDLERIGALSQASVRAPAMATVGSTGVGGDAGAGAVTDGEAGGSGAGAGGTGRWLAPRGETVAHIAMCLAMGYMLLISL